jgi:hypothetical protein
MNVTADDIAAAARNLAAIAGVFKPKEAAAFALLVEAASHLNTLVRKIAAQTEADSPAVWAEVQTDFTASISAWEASAQTIGDNPQ